MSKAPPLKTFCRIFVAVFNLRKKTAAMSLNIKTTHTFNESALWIIYLIIAIKVIFFDALEPVFSIGYTLSKPKFGLIF